MKKVLIFFGLLSLGITVFIYVIAQTGLENILEMLAKVTVLQIVFYLTISLVNFSFFVIRWWLILRSHGHRVPFYMLYFYRMVGYSVSYLTPVAQSGGEPFRIYFLNERHKISLKESASSVVIDKVFEMSALLFFIGGGVFYTVLKGFFSLKMEIVLVLFIFIALYFLYIFYKKTLDNSGFFSSIFRFFRLSKIGRIKHFEAKIIHTERFISKFFNKSPGYVVPLCVFLSVLTVGVTIFEHWLLTTFFGLNLSFSSIFLITVLPSIAYIVPIPGGFGLLEGGHSSVFTLLALNPVIAVALVLLIRARDLFFVITGLIFGAHHGLWLLVKSEAAKKIRKMIR